MADKRDVLKLLGALLAVPLFGLGSSQAFAKAAKKKTKKKTTKKKAKRKTKKKAKKKTTKRKAKKKTTKRPTKVSEPGTLALMGAGLVAAGVAQKMGRRKKQKV